MSVCNVCVCSGTLLMMMPKNTTTKKSNANKQAKQQKTKQKNAQRENVFYSIANNKRRRILDCFLFSLFLFQFSCLIS